MPNPQMHANVVPGPWLGFAHPAAPAPRRTPERRKLAPVDDPEQLRAGLTPGQLVTLEAMEIFRWRLAFVRRPLFQAPIPVLFDKDDTRYVVILEDGTLDEYPTLKLRG
jgi:hypothetical protein